MTAWRRGVDVGSPDRRDQGRRKERADLPREAVCGENPPAAVSRGRKSAAPSRCDGPGEPALDARGASSFQDCEGTCLGRPDRTTGVGSGRVAEAEREAPESAAWPPAVTASGST